MGNFAKQFQQSSVAGNHKGTANRWYARLLQTSVSMLAIASPTAAQVQEVAVSQAEAGAEAGLQEIIVTAQRRSQNLQDVPISAVAFGQQQLEVRAALDISSLNGLVPNVNLENIGFFPGAASISIRGVGVSSIESFIDPEVAVYVNGVYQARTATALSSTLDVSGIEILRGPQGTLYGRNALAGAVTLRTNQPVLDEFGGSASATLGNYDRQDLVVVGNVPIVEGKVAARLAVQSHAFDGFYKRDGVIDQTGAIDLSRQGKPSSRERYFYARPSIRFRPNDTIDSTFFGEYYRNRSDAYTGRQILQTPLTPLNGNCGAVTLANSATPELAKANGVGLYCGTSTAALAGFPGSNPFGDPATGERGDGSDPFTVGHAFNNGHSNITQYVLTNNSVFTTAAGSVRLAVNYTHEKSDIQTTTSGISPAIFASQRFEKYKSASADLSFTSSFSDVLDLTAGAFVFYDRYKTSQLLFNTAAGPGFGLYTGIFDNNTPSPPLLYGVNSARRFTYAVYAQGEYKITPDLSVVVGGRYSYEKKYDAFGMPVRTLGANGFTTRPRFGDFELSPTESAVYGPIKDDWQSFSPRVGFNYKYSDDVLLYGFWQRAFKSGGFNMNASDTVAFATPYGQEQVDSFEGGIKTDLLDRRLRMNVNAFYSKFNGLQRTVLTPNSTNTATTTITSNAADLKSYGLEFEITARPIRSLTLYANGGLLKASYTSFCTDLDGAELSPVPQSGRAACGGVRAVTNPLSGVTQYLVDADYSSLKPQRSPKFSISAGFIQDFNVDAGKLSFAGSVHHAGRQATSVTNDPRTERDALTTVDASVGFRSIDDRYSINLFARNLFNQVELLNGVALSNLFLVGAPTAPRTFGATFGVNF